MGSRGARTRASGQRVRGADERPGVTPAAVLGGGSLCSAAALASRLRLPQGGGGGPAALGLAAGWRAAPLLPWLPPSVPRPCCHTGGFLFCSLSPRACVVFPSSSRAVEASFLQLPPALSASWVPAHTLVRACARRAGVSTAVPPCPLPPPPVPSALSPLGGVAGAQAPVRCPQPL